VFNSAKIFETDNKHGRNIQLEIGGSVSSLFTYFLDGSRRTYKIVDFGSTDGKFLPIVAGQIGAAVCVRRRKKLKKYALKRENAIALPDRMGGEFKKLAGGIPKTLEEIKVLLTPCPSLEGIFGTDFLISANV
ncbi:MAG: hypothetical protein GY801_50080, partial [bacterium]|nr:hypothetical protein [bacterium]